jgi:hypothetical protein
MISLAISNRHVDGYPRSSRDFKASVSTTSFSVLHSTSRFQSNDRSIFSLQLPPLDRLLVRQMQMLPERVGILQLFLADRAGLWLFGMNESNVLLQSFHRAQDAEK